MILGTADGLYVAESDGVLKCPTAGTGTADAVAEGAANGLYTAGIAVGATNGLYPFVTPEAGAPNRFTGGDLSNRPTVSPGTCAVAAAAAVVVGYNGEKDGLYTGGADDAPDTAAFGALNGFTAGSPNMFVFGTSENGELSGLDHDAGAGPPPNTDGVLGPPNSGGAAPDCPPAPPKAVANKLPEAAAAVLVFRVPKRPPLIAGVAVTACTHNHNQYIRTKKPPTSPTTSCITSTTISTTTTTKKKPPPFVPP